MKPTLGLVELERNNHSLLLNKATVPIDKIISVYKCKLVTCHIQGPTLPRIEFHAYLVKDLRRNGRNTLQQNMGLFHKILVQFFWTTELLLLLLVSHNFMECSIHFSRGPWIVSSTF